MKRLSQILKASDPVIAFRIHVLECHAKHGTSSAVDAFRVSKATIYRWRKKYIGSRNDPVVLIPISTKPHHFRSMGTDYRVINFIREIRKERGKIGKEKIKYLLDKFCILGGMKTISISTIGKVIKRYNLNYSPSRRVYHNPSSGWATARKKPRDRIRRSPRVENSGYVEIDTIIKFIDGIKLYVFNAIDVYTRFCFSYAYWKGGSTMAVDFYKKLEQVYPLESGIKVVQTDNGSEYLGDFDEYLKQHKIKHVFIYPRCPRINGYVERANRTLQEEYLERKLYTEELNLEKLNLGLMDYLVWYNTERVHKGLHNQTPVNFILSKLPKSQMYVTHTII